MRAVLLLAVAACHVAALAAIAGRGHGTIAARAQPIVVALLAAPEPKPPRSSPSIAPPLPPPSAASPQPPRTSPPLASPPRATTRRGEARKQARPGKAVAARRVARPAAPTSAAPEPMPAPPVPASPTPPDTMARPEPPPEPGSDRTADTPATATAQAPFTPARYDDGDSGNRRPRYPLASRRMGEQGTVVLRVDVSAAGSVDKLDIETSSGSDRLDHAAASTVAQWRFQPARRGSVAVASSLPIRIVFRLED